MSRAHQSSKIPLVGTSIGVDSNNVFLAHYDASANDIRGIAPKDENFIDNSCLTYLKMDNLNSSKTYVVDKSRYGNHGKIIGGAQVSNGRTGQGLRVDNGIYLEAPISVPNLFTSSTSFTLETWVNITGTAGTTGDNIVFGGEGYHWGIVYYGSTSNFRAVLWTDNAGTKASIQASTAASSITPGNWYHVVATYDVPNKTIKIYLNGVFIQSSTWTYTPYFNASGLLHVGTYVSGWTQAYVDQAALYNRILSADEVAARYNATICTMRPDGKFGWAAAIEEATTNLVTLFADTSWSLSKSNYQGIRTITTGSNIFKTSCRFDFKPKLDPGTSGWQVAQYGSVLKTYDTGLQYTISIWIRSFRPDLGQINLRLLNGNGQDVVFDTGAYVPTSTDWVRWTATFTPLIAGNDPVLYITTNENNSFELADPQVEQKAYATSFTPGYRAPGKLLYPKEIINTTQGTISFWLYVEGSNSTQPIFSSGIDGAADGGLGTFDMIFNPAGDSYLRAYNGPSTATQLRPTIPTRQWIHVVCVWSKGTWLAVYLNGTLAVSSQTPVDWEPGYLSSAKGFYIGSGIRGNPSILIDELRIDNVSRTADEILSWYVSGCPFSPASNERVIL